MNRRRLAAVVITSLIPVALVEAASLSADSTRGAEVFRLQGCIECHSLDGVGPAVGPDLGRLIDRGFTPAALAATMWNHAPAMWAEVRLKRTARPAMDEQQAADLFAFFYSLRFFEEPGDAGRGKVLFTERKCSACHGITESKVVGIKPAAEWAATNNPVELVQTMWNHSTSMRAEMTARKIDLPQLTGQDLADLLVYTRRAGGRLRPPPAPFISLSTEQGGALFESKGCIKCHGAVTHFLTIGLRDETLTDIAADMWNHGFDMSLRNTTFAPGEMRQIANFIWYSRAIEGAGEAGKGAHVFSAKKCAVCHDDPGSGAPSLAGAAANGRHFSGVTMVSALTRHGPTMLDKMQQKHLAWPRLSADEMSALIAYLNSRVGRNGR